MRFEELVLLKCDFEMWPSREEAATDAGGSEAEAEAVRREDTDGVSQYPTDHLLRWKSTVTREGDELFLYMSAKLDTPQLPFRLLFDVGVRYMTSLEEQTTTEALKPTLVWIAYPFLRELVYNLTARTPVPPYALPPLTRLPDPSLAGDASDDAEQ
ncbi:MAG TPA: hypothetical protein VGG08_08440 [Solirubrobacteraceae bacterium]